MFDYKFVNYQRIPAYPCIFMHICDLRLGRKDPHRATGLRGAKVEGRARQRQLHEAASGDPSRGAQSQHGRLEHLGQFQNSGGPEMQVLANIQYSILCNLYNIIIYWNYIYIKKVEA